MKNNKFSNVLIATFGLFLGHLLYEDFLADVPNYSKAVEDTWYQFNALVLYWWFYTE